MESDQLDLQEHLKLDPPSPLHESVYLGDGQRNIVIDRKHVQEMTEVDEEDVQQEAEGKWPIDASCNVVLAIISFRTDAKANLEGRHVKEDGSKHGSMI